LADVGRNHDAVVRNNDMGEEKLRAACETLVADAQQLRRIGGLNIIRAAHIQEKSGDEEVAQLLISEAAVMLSVASQIEELFCPPTDADANL
jgi:hypothetical protein